MLTPVIYTPFFYVYTNLARGSTWNGAIEDTKLNYVDSCKAYWLVWGPGQLVSFGMIPPSLRILFIYGVEFFWSVTISFLANRGANAETDAAQSFDTVKDTKVTANVIEAVSGDNSSRS